MICPKCKSSNVKKVKYMDIDCIVCSDCNYDERSIYEIYPEEKKSQKAKGSYSPYKSGGGRGIKK